MSESKPKRPRSKKPAKVSSVSKKRVAQEEVESAPRKRVVRTTLAAAAIARQLKTGFEDKDLRMSVSAVATAVEYTERMLMDLGEECRRVVDISGKKTVTKKCILDCLQRGHIFSGDVILVKKSKAPARRPGQNPIRLGLPVAAVVNAFSEGLSEGYRVADEAKYILTYLAIEYVRHLGSSASKYTLSGKRQTVSINDMTYAFDCI